MEIDWQTVLTSILSSGIVSTVLVFALKKIFEKQIEYRFDRKLEEYKSDLEVRSDQKRELGKHRIEDYRKLAEQVYRIRNALKMIVEAKTFNVDRCLEYIKHTDPYVEQIYISRLDLERDEIFLQLHEYKNLALTIKSQLMDLVSGDKASQAAKLGELQVLYKELDRQYNDIIGLLNKNTKEE